MALRQPLFMQNGSHSAEDLRMGAQGLWRATGILSSGDLAVSQSGTPAMSVSIATGWAAILGTFAANQGCYIARNDAAVTANITAADPTNPRIDLICLTVSDAYYSGALSQIAVNVVTGTPSVSPAVPATPINSIVLAQVAVAAAATTIVNANITDKRVVATLGDLFMTTAPNQVLTSPIEFTNIIAAAPAATQNIDLDTAGDHLFTTNCANNWTLNLRASATVSLNTRMAIGQTKTISVRVVQGATNWYQTAFQIDGTPVTPKWQGGTAPTTGDASASDIYVFAITKTAANTYTVLASLTKFA